MQDLLNRLEAIRLAGDSFRSLTEQVDTSTPSGAILLHVMGAFAQLERDLIRERTRAGVAAAKARGVKFGQPKKLNPAQLKQARRWRKELISVREIVDLIKQDFGIKVSPAAVQKYTTGLGRRRKPKGR